MDLPALHAVLTVSQLNRRIQSTLDRMFDEVWVVGEISNFRVPPSGHFYFRLKDERSQIAAVMFRSANQTLPFRPEDGLEVIVRGRVGLYDVRGDLQFYAESMEPRGLGGLQLALEQLKQRLAAEGLFADARKRPLPFFPRTVGVVTSLKGAAIHDVLTVLQSRCPGIHALVRPVRVQGDGAAPDIVQAIADLNEDGRAEVIIVGRGGGSLEDLWAFNDERVVRAIAASRAPVVSAVGHEIDVTVADLVADRRAPTPTAAAAMVVPERRELLARLEQLDGSLRLAARRHLRRHSDRIAALARHLRDPRQVLKNMQQRIDELSERTLRAAGARLRFAQQQLRGTAERLQALSPLAVLQRGYSITRHASDGAVVRDAATLHAGEDLRLMFARGSARVRVDETTE
ncbi:MAG: exodeoxyribonuclease VII large subunit [Candidatus Binatia bacterium]